MLINLLFSILFASGVYFIFLAFTQPRGDEVQALVQRRGRRRMLNSPLEQLKILLFQARAPITVPEFLLTSLIMGIGIGFIFFFATRALFLSILMVSLGGVAYHMILLSRRDAASKAYERLQPQVLYIVRSAFKTEGLDFRSVIDEVVDRGPKLVVSDWQKIGAAMSTAKIDYRALNELLTYRNSPALSHSVEALLLFRNQMDRLPIILDRSRKEVNQDIQFARESEAEVTEPRIQLRLVALAPAFFMLLLSLIAEPYREIYSSLGGQLISMALLAVNVVIYLWGNRKAVSVALVRPYVATIPESRTEDEFTIGARKDTKETMQSFSRAQIGAQQEEDSVTSEEDLKKTDGQPRKRRGISKDDFEGGDDVA